VRRFTRQSPICKTVLLLATLSWLTGTCLAGQQDTVGPLRYETPQGVTFEVSDKGLSMIRFGDRIVAKGGWSVFNADQSGESAEPRPVAVVGRRCRRSSGGHRRLFSSYGKRCATGCYLPTEFPRYRSASPKASYT
jgi:hypothetical protein